MAPAEPRKVRSGIEMFSKGVTGGPAQPPGLDGGYLPPAPLAEVMKAAMSFLSCWWSARRTYIMWPAS